MEMLKSLQFFLVDLSKNHGLRLFGKPYFLMLGLRNGNA